MKGDVPHVPSDTRVPYEWRPTWTMGTNMFGPKITNEMKQVVQKILWKWYLNQLIILILILFFQALLQYLVSPISSISNIASPISRFSNISQLQYLVSPIFCISDILYHQYLVSPISHISNIWNIQVSNLWYLISNT